MGRQNALVGSELPSLVRLIEVSIYFHGISWWYFLDMFLKQPILYTILLAFFFLPSSALMFQPPKRSAFMRHLNVLPHCGFLFGGSEDWVYLLTFWARVVFMGLAFRKVPSHISVGPKLKPKSMLNLNRNISYILCLGKTSLF